MNKDIYLCREGNCGNVDMSFIYPDEKIKHYGLCCNECDKKDKCLDRCAIIKHRHLKVEECDFRKNYKHTLKEIIEEKRESISNSRKEISKLEQEIANMEEKLNIKSPLECHVCGNKQVSYDTTKALLSCPPKYMGVCQCGTTRYVDVRVYREFIKK